MKQDIDQEWLLEVGEELPTHKHLGLVAGCSHLKYRLFFWQPIPADRAVRVDVEKIS